MRFASWPVIAMSDFFSEFISFIDWKSLFAFLPFEKFFPIVISTAFRSDSTFLTSQSRTLSVFVDLICSFVTNFEFFLVAQRPSELSNITNIKEIPMSCL